MAEFEYPCPGGKKLNLRHFGYNLRFEIPKIKVPVWWWGCTQIWTYKERFLQFVKKMWFGKNVCHKVLVIVTTTDKNQSFHTKQVKKGQKLFILGIYVK